MIERTGGKLAAANHQAKFDAGRCQRDSRARLAPEKLKRMRSRVRSGRGKTANSEMDSSGRQNSRFDSLDLSYSVNFNNQYLVDFNREK
ncbi:hypothetical protein KW851_25880 [Pseudomonas sp. PDM33]|uniref:hypothetical protein n=1 Tax=Pseudomonas sp. PDM33 TaxID=2854765 RepID=UPI0012E05603|nr:hypothetical protein [Pseudomonas sp. PDM33]MBV7586285.1 hypothetical protein [Pseudomonas sp. PDM33]